MNKKIASEIAIGIMLLIILVFGGIFYLKNKKQNQLASSDLLSNKQAQNATDQKASSQEMIEENVIPENAIANRGQINTKYGYDKSMELIKGEARLGLADIAIIKSSTSDYDQYKNKIMFSFYSNTKAITTAYDYTTGDVSIFEKRDVKGNSFDVIIPDDIIKFGYEGASALLEKNPDYVSYKAKFPELFNNEIVGVVKDDKYGWEWRFSFISKQQSLRMIVFSINSSSGKIVVLKKNKVD